jgi:hypothetical protein
MVLVSKDDNLDSIIEQILSEKTLTKKIYMFNVNHYRYSLYKSN